MNHCLLKKVLKVKKRLTVSLVMLGNRRSSPTCGTMLMWTLNCSMPPGLYTMVQFTETQQFSVKQEVVFYGV